MDVCIHNNILDTIRNTGKKLLRFKLSKSGQTLHVDNTGFSMLDPIYACSTVSEYRACKQLLCVVLMFYCSILLF